MLVFCRIKLLICISLRTYQPGDEPGFYRVMALAGWPGWDDDKLRPWLARIPPGGWFMAVHDQSGDMVATAMALHDHSDLHPFGGELGWVAGDPAHAGKGLGMAVCAAVTGRLIAAGYRDIHLYTEHWRLAAIKTYLKLGYIPLLVPARNVGALACRLRPVGVAVHTRKLEITSLSFLLFVFP